MNKKISGIIAGVIIAVIIVGITILSVSELETEPTKLMNNNQSLGLVINTPSDTTSLQQLDEIYAQASSTGIGRSNVYMFWNVIEPEKGLYDWEQSDVLMSFNEKNNLKVTLYFSIINGENLGPFPSWIGRPSLISVPEDSLVSTLDAILSRYNIIDTVIIGAEIDQQFRYNEHQIEVYDDLFNNVYEEIKSKHPNVKIGNAFSLHRVLINNLEHVVKELDQGDFVAFTYFPVDSLNEIVKSPSEAREDLEKIFDMVPDKKVAMFEISWSTSDFVGGNNQDQVEFLGEAYDFYNDHSESFEFFTWYRQYDKPEGTCNIIPESLDSEDVISIGGGSGFGNSEFIIQRIGYYLCSSGLIDADENPKTGWEEFKNQIQKFDKQ